VAKDSHNSSRPPSTDPPWAKRTRSLRWPSGRRPGGQAGHLGETLRLSERPDRTVEHRPRECRGCHTPLAAAHVVRHRRQQVVEVVPARLKVTEHRLAVLRCPACGRTTSGEFAGAVRSGVQYGPGVKARVLYLQQYQLLPYQRTSEAMRDLFGCRLSPGTVANIVRECSDGLVETELKIKRGLRRSPVIHADETGLRVNKRLQYVHVASNARLTHYAAASHRAGRPSTRSMCCRATAGRASTTGCSPTPITSGAGMHCAASTRLARADVLRGSSSRDEGVGRAAQRATAGGAAVPERLLRTF
jgi:transposase